MEGSHVKELIQKWRALSKELKENNVELEKTRAALQELEGQHAKTVQDWDLEKANIQNTISLVWEQVSKKKEELSLIEKETSDLQLKVDERRVRNEEHWGVLNKRKQAVAARLQEIEEKEKDTREGLRQFREAREESKQQLLSAIRKFEDAEQQERVEHQQKTRQVRTRIAELVASIEAEKKSWALDTAMREWNQRNDARRWLSEEANAAEASKGVWAEVIKEGEALHCDDALKELDALCALVSC
ncbi:hypothetical protein TraAM80_07599 [Trypanosoma rangeli]|uniref:Uncharacterized protein n=1 Tax=Trypanosoma rangeli TaxID=5698 RepID=A0A3R7M6L3_TRYRA|nr:uncharacterized protein TraAM80_07599 [Trypanosoma rangeli]RNF00406.1 hypothetical protein TraAM80_07599 [Trypanosoma rangeli]|eukprot:RNF00406.1 hypothetical protein TraAM80_07599 [Trypanosoma rangeli]